jgi:ABC-type branched-subunit amino acid transport system permease subunit
MDQVQVVRSTAASRGALVAAAALVLLAATLPCWAPEGSASSWMRDFVEIACYFIFAMMWNLLAGYGGMGSFYGTLAGGIILGITQAIGFRIDPGWGIWAGHVVFLAMLLFRPSGLFPKTR